MEESTTLLSNGMVIKVIGFLITALLSGIIGLIIYVWNQRKKMLELEFDKRDQFNKTLEKDVVQMKEGIQKIDDQTDKLDILVREVHETNRNLIGWMKEMQRQLVELSGDVKHNSLNIERIKKQNN